MAITDYGEPVERGDISAYAPPGLAVLFEGVLASPPDTLGKVIANIRLRANDYDAYLTYWKAHEIPLKHVIDTINRKQIGVVVYTLLPVEVAEAIDRWLIKRNISTTVVPYADIDDLTETSKFFPEIKTIYVADQEYARRIGMKATVVTPETSWNL